MSWNISLITTFKSFPGQALDFLILSICSMLTWTLLMVRNASRSLLVGNHLSFYSTLRYWDYEKKEKEIWCLYKIDRPNLSHCGRGAFCLEMHQNDVFFYFLKFIFDISTPKKKEAKALSNRQKQMGPYSYMCFCLVLKRLFWPVTNQVASIKYLNTQVVLVSLWTTSS